MARPLMLRPHLSKCSTVRKRLWRIGISMVPLAITSANEEERFNAMVGENNISYVCSQ